MRRTSAAWFKPECSRPRSLLFLLVLFIAVARTWALHSEYYVGPRFEGREVEASPARIDNPCASGLYNARIAEVGWNFLHVQSNQSCGDLDQAFAAGFVEGALTAQQVWDHWQNTLASFQPSARLKEYLSINDAYIRQQATKQHADDDAAYWWQVRLLLEQLHGLEQGYNYVMPNSKHLTSTSFLIMNLAGDLEDLNVILEEDVRGAARVLQQKRVKSQVILESTDGPGQDPPGPMLVAPGRCSAFIKVSPGNADLYTSQVNWSSLESMLRIFKMYDFPVHATPEATHVIPGTRSSFSSYPGRIFSGDDFYLISSGLAVQETTIGNDNDELYRKYITPAGTVLEWMRNLVANRLATSGAEWTAIFARRNSGTYNNQWMVVDYKLFKPGQEVVNNTLWVLEQLPGYVERQDMSFVLRRQGYWASYNSPAFPKVFEMSGLPDLVAKYGDWFSHDRCPRALIFKREAPKVRSPESLQRLLRYNDYQHDPLSRCSPCTPPFSAENAIAARGDLNPANGSYPISYLGQRDHAATDAKYTSVQLFKDLSSRAVSGPTYDQQPVFEWSTSPFVNTSHHGHPDRWEFPWLKVQWNSTIHAL